MNENYLPPNKKYISFGPIINSKADIILIPTNKGSGKTYQAIRQALIFYQQNGRPSAYIRSTLEQLKEFVGENKFGAILDDLGWKLDKSEYINSKGFFKTQRKSKFNPNRVSKPIIYFGSLNQAMTIQSSKFLEMNLVIIDEVQHHFRKTGENTVNQMINIVSSMIRDYNSKIWILFNLVNQNDILLQKFKVDREVGKVKVGHINKFKRTFHNHNGGFVELKIGIFKPKQSTELLVSKENSVSQKLSYISNYGRVINSNDFFMKRKNLKYISKLGKFKGIINLNGFEVGFWLTDKNIYQFSNILNKNGAIKYFSYKDYALDSQMGDVDFIKDIKRQLIRNKVEFSNQEVFLKIVDLLKTTY